MAKNRLYLAVTKDKYELPIAVAGTIRELAEMVGIKEGSLKTLIYKYYAGQITSCKYRRVELEDEE